MKNATIRGCYSAKVMRSKILSFAGKNPIDRVDLEWILPVTVRVLNSYEKILKNPFKKSG